MRKQLDMAVSSAKIVAGKDLSQTVLKVHKVIGNKKSQETKKKLLDDVRGVNNIRLSDFKNWQYGVNGSSWLRSDYDWQQDLARRVKK